MYVPAVQRILQPFMCSKCFKRIDRVQLQTGAGREASGEAEPEAKKEPNGHTRDGGLHD